jgi:sulfatase maturation enzyme AslB (radical SAM superfamily)
MPMKQAGDNEGVFWKNRHTCYANLRNLDIVGGEPMYIKQWHTVFDELIELGYSKNINLYMSTNCTIIMPDLIKKLKDNFHSVDLHLSIDGTGKIFEYLRHPAKWDLAYSNMKIYHDLIDSSNFRVKITNTVSWLNALEMSKIYSLVKKEFPKFSSVWYNPLHGPSMMAIENIPEDLKNYIAEQFRTYDWGNQKNDVEGIINLMFSIKTDPTVFAGHIEEHDKIDRRRNENIWDVMPNEYLPFLSKYRSPALIATDRDETGDNMT